MDELRWLTLADFAGRVGETFAAPDTEQVLVLTHATEGSADGGTGPDGESMPFRDLARSTITYAFDRLEDTASRDGPDFVFAHITAPHPPYVFNADGSFPTHEEVDNRPERDSYVAQVQWVNQRVLQAIDTLMDHDPGEPDPIIVLQADEGPFPPGFTANESGFEWLEASPRDIQQKYGILNAWYIPGVEDLGLDPSMSAINTFPTLFARYFGIPYPLLEERVYASRDWYHPYDLTDITDRLPSLQDR